MIAHGQQIDTELDTGPRRTRQTERLCIATRTVLPVDALIRFVVAPGGEVVPDRKHNLPGRGVWVTATRQALETAVRHNAFARGFKRNVRVAPDLAASTEGLLEQAMLDALAMVRKAGLVVTGFAKTEKALEHQSVVALLHAAEASPDGVNKLAGGWRSRQEARPPVVVRILTSAQLDLALGRPNVVHAAVLAGPASDTFVSRLRRLEGFRAGDASERGNQAGSAARQQPAIDYGCV